MAMSDPKPILLSLHRKIALHHRAAVARFAAADAAASPDDIDTLDMGRPFDDRDPAQTAREIARKLDVQCPDWMTRPLYFLPPGLPKASDAWKDELRKRLHPAAFILRQGPYRNEYGPALPALWVVNGVLALGQTEEDVQEVRPEYYEAERPKHVTFLDLALHPMAGAFASDLWRDEGLSRWYPDGPRLLAVTARSSDKPGPPDIRPLERLREEYVPQLRGWLLSHPAIVGELANGIPPLDFDNEPIVLSWFEASDPQLVSALVCLHTLTGGFPAFAVYARDTATGEDAGSYPGYRARIADLSGIRQQYRQVRTPDSVSPRVVPRGDRERPERTSPIAVSWMVNRWARHYVHVRDQYLTGLRCAPALAARLATPEERLETCLKWPEYSRHSLLVQAADATLDAEEITDDQWRPAMKAVWAHAYAKGRAWTQRPPCQSLEELLRKAQEHVAASEDAAGIAVEIHAQDCGQDKWFIWQEPFNAAILNLAVQLIRPVTGNGLGGGHLLLSCRYDTSGTKLYLGVAHNGVSLIEPAIQSIMAIRGGGTRSFTDFANEHLATLRVIWCGGDGKMANEILQWNAGAYRFGDPRKAFPLEEIRPASGEWCKRPRRELIGGAGVLPDVHSTLWEFELNGDLLKLGSGMPQEW